MVRPGLVQVQPWDSRLTQESKHKNAYSCHVVAKLPHIHKYYKQCSTDKIFTKFCKISLSIHLSAPEARCK